MRAHLEHTPEEQAFVDELLAHLPRGGPMGPARQAEKLAAASLRTIEDFSIHGKDISSYQPVGNFIEGGRRFAFFKASEGTGYRDKHFAGNRDAAGANPNIAHRGLYDFARPGRNSADEEFDNFMAVVDAPQPGESAILDFEVAPWNEAWACRWADLAHAAGFTSVGFYTYSAMWTANPHNQIVKHFDWGWVAGYQRTLPQMPGWPAGRLLFWQHTDGQASVPGNDGGTDCSVFLPNDINALAALGGGAMPNPQPQPEDDDMKQLCVMYNKNGGPYLTDGLDRIRPIFDSQAKQDYIAAGAVDLAHRYSDEEIQAIAAHAGPDHAARIAESIDTHRAPTPAPE